MLLFRIVKQLFRGQAVSFEHKHGGVSFPSGRKVGWCGVSILTTVVHPGKYVTTDIFVPSLHLALEYQGEQHYDFGLLLCSSEVWCSVVLCYCVVCLFVCNQHHFSGMHPSESQKTADAIKRNILAKQGEVISCHSAILSSVYFCRHSHYCGSIHLGLHFLCCG